MKAVKNLTVLGVYVLPFKRDVLFLFFGSTFALYIPICVNI